MAEVKMVPTEKPDIQITLTWDEAKQFKELAGGTHWTALTSGLYESLTEILSEF